MTIRFRCRCGHQMAVKDEAAGKIIRCRECSTKIRVPQKKQPVVAEEAWDEGGSEFDEFDGSSGEFHVDLQACGTSEAGIGRQFLAAMRKSVIEYLQESPEVFQNAYLRLSMKTVRQKNHSLIRLSVSGNVNGRSIHANLNRKIVFKQFGGGSIAGTAMAVVMNTASKLTEAAMRASANNPNLVPEMQTTCRELLVDVYQSLDKSAGRGESSQVSFWKTWHTCAIIAAVASFALLAFVLISRAKGEAGAAAAGALMFALPIAALVYFLVTSLGITVMPESFFLRESVGRKVLRFTGAKTPMGGRIVAFITSCVLLGLCILVLVMMNSE
ncbi:MAG: hypothetical protein Tsb009_28330 [Planctomycetaceae bacterium]